MIRAILEKTKGKKSLSSTRTQCKRCHSNSIAANLRDAELIVNKYGEALEKAARINGLAVIDLVRQMSTDYELCEDVAHSLEGKRGYYYNLLSHRVQTSLLPYPKKTIREALELLLEYEKNPDSIILLKEGLRYLNYFD